MTPGVFALAITRQGWIEPGVTESPADLCSHGDVRVEIGGCVISPGDGEGDYTISTSALALLRTLESDHSRDDPVADRLLLHCGGLEMLTCPVGIDWTVKHRAGRVHLSDVVRYDTVDEAEAIRFPGVEVEVAEADYRRRIVEFATLAKQPFVGAEKTPRDDYERQAYEEFWREYDARLSRALR